MAGPCENPSLSYPLGSTHVLPESVRQWLEVLILAILYVVLARIGQTLAIPPGNVTPVWLPSGVIFAAMLLRGYYLWPGVFLGAFAGNIWAYFDPAAWDIAVRSVAAGFLNGLGDVACAWVGAHAVAIQLKRGEPYLNVVTCGYFVVFAVMAGPLISALLGVGGLFGLGFLPYEQFAVTLLTWLTGDAVGVLVIGSMVLAWHVPRDSVLEISQPGKFEYLIFLVTGAALLVLSLLFIYGKEAFTTGLPLMFLLPMLAWSILRLGVRWTFATTTLVASLAIIIFAVKFAESSEVQINAGLVVLQSFIAVLVVTVMLLTSISYQWADAFQKMEDAKKEAEESSSFKSNFLSSVSHELRTPMNGVIGFVDLLHSSHLEAAQSGYVDGIEKSAKHMMTLIEELLDLAKAESGQIDLHEVSYSPASLMDETAELFEHLLHQNQVTLHVQVDRELPQWLIADTKRIKQVLLNFISNAFKFTSSGQITLTAELENKQQVRFSVQDSGIGIDPDEQAFIFEPFSQASHTRYHHGGTGLGLHISSRIIKSMGGTIGVDSAPGEGSTFWFRLPLQQGLPNSEQQAGAMVQRYDPLGLNILVCEDNPVNSALLTKLLEHFGCQSQLATHGEKGLELAMDQHFDVILMDCMMPVMDGYQAARAIRQQADINQGTPIIALTANALRENRDKCLEYGMNEFLTKPLNARQLYVALSRHSHYDPLSSLDEQA